MSPVEIRAGSTMAVVEPDVGFNLRSLVVDGFDYVHAEPGFPAEGKPTHNGTPVLFPWPNRIAGARFTWEGAEYELPRNEPSTGCSIHGYAVAAPWRVVTSGPDHVTGEFIVERDSPWPARGALQLTYRVEPTALIATCEVSNLDDRDLPSGLGFHPYLRVPGPFEQWLLQVDASQAFDLAGMVPTGAPVAVPPQLDFRRPRRIGDQHLDDVLTGMTPAEGLVKRAGLHSMASSVTISSDPAFRDYVVFTNASRTAVAIEPYTCATDAVHLQERGVEAGWRVLAPGATQICSWRVDVA